MAEVTKNLTIPLLEGNNLVSRREINNALKTVDENALPLSHKKSGGHWNVWEAGKNYLVGDIIRTDDCYSWGFLQCTTAGISGTTVPACPYGEGDIITDGTIVWKLQRVRAAITEHGELSGRNLKDQHPISAITDLQTTLEGKENIANKGKANGYPSLDANCKIPITQLPASIKEMRVVADIAARNTITGDDLYDGLRVRVLDATGDSTVKSGWAEYTYDEANTTWIKLSEKESMDIVLDWGNLQSIPEVLKKLTVLEGKLLYNGTAVYIDTRCLVFVGGDSQYIYPWTGSVQTIQITVAEPRDADLLFSVEKQTKEKYTAKTGLWELIGGGQLTLPAGQVYQEYPITGATVTAGDVIRASTVGDDTGITFQVIIKNN